MVIFLPLLFADGQPTSLEKISQFQLEKFIPFMISCCPGVIPGKPPAWWPSSVVPYRLPLCAPSHLPYSWSDCLKKIVCRCYEYHKCEHVLRFCSRLADLPQSHLKYKETNGFVSIYDKISDKLIVTFKKKNQIYDKHIQSPFKNLLPRKPSSQPQNNIIEDIYLCNYCDEEFTIARDALAHEAKCKAAKVNEEVQNNSVINQVDLLRYFDLAPTSSRFDKQSNAKRGTSIKLSARTYTQVPISSPLGLKMISNVQDLKRDDVIMNCIRRMETHCHTVDLADSAPNRRARAYRSYRKKPKDTWTHIYCFNKSQRKERRITLATGLNKRSRYLMQKCQKAVVLVEKLPILDPLAIHAAARLNLTPALFREQLENSDSPPTTVSMDLTTLNTKENCGGMRNNPDIFVHKRPPLKEKDLPSALILSAEPISSGPTYSSQNLFLPITSF